MLELLKCPCQNSIYQALKQINENGLGIVFIIDDNNLLKGVLTDGDIRRFILNGGGLDEKVVKVLNKDFTYAYKNESSTQILKRLGNGVTIVPIVDNDFYLIDYFEYKNQIHIPVAFPDLQGNEFNYLLDAFISTWISSSGEYIEKFELSFANYCGCKYGVAVSNGTIALQLALKTLNLDDGDEVIIPDLTFAATINAVLNVNLTPVIVDVKQDTWNIDSLEIKKAITPKTKAIIPVHLYGQPCNMDEIIEVANQHNLYIIEDCAEAHGAEYKSKKIGSFSDISCFSFFANKIITTGEGGMCLTNNEEHYEKMRTLRDHGMSRKKKYWHVEVGYNYRMTNLQASIGVAQLERINEILEQRKSIEEIYKKHLKDIRGISFQLNNLPNKKKVTWLMCALIDEKRDKIIEILQDNKFDVRPFFYPLSEMDIFKKYVFSNSNSKLISYKGINLPTNRNINEEKIIRIVELIKSNM